MADQANEFNWDEVTGRVTERLRAPKIAPVPEAIVRQAQRSYDGVPRLDKENKPVTDGEGTAILDHVLTFRFKTDEQAAAFAKHMRNAGNHTVPQTSVSVVIDPEGKDDLKHVAWKAGKRRGRTAT